MDKSGKLTIQRHRRKNERRRFYPFCALVARPVGDREIREQPSAQKAMKDEWNRLRAKNVWGEHEDKNRRYPPAHGRFVLGCSMESWGRLGNVVDDLLLELHGLAQRRQRDRGISPTNWLLR